MKMALSMSAGGGINEMAAACMAALSAAWLKITINGVALGVKIMTAEMA